MIIRVGLQFDSGGLGLELLVHVAGPWRIHAPAFPLPFGLWTPYLRGFRCFGVFGLSAMFLAFLKIVCFHLLLLLGCQHILSQ